MKCEIFFYTRKSLINDAVAIFEAGANGLFIKPTGLDDSETRLSTKQYAPELIEGLSRIVDRHVDNLSQFNKAYEAKFPLDKKDLARLSRAWKAFRNR